MRVGEALVATAVAGLAIFIGAQIIQRADEKAHFVQLPPIAEVPAKATPRAAPPPPASRDTGPDEKSTVTQSATVSAPKDVEAARARIAASSGTYMNEMLADLNGSLTRWPDRREQGLRVWVQPLTSVHDWDLRYLQMARSAFAEWGMAADGGGVPVRLDFIFDSATAEVRVVWIEKFPPSGGLRVGTTRRVSDQNGWISAAEIIVAVHDSAGRTIPPEHLAGIVRHEAGHALGLGHSTDPRTKMYPMETVPDIQPADRATLRLLYQLPPGRIR